MRTLSISLYKVVSNAEQIYSGITVQLKTEGGALVATAAETPVGSSQYVATWTEQTGFGYWYVSGVQQTNLGKIWLGRLSDYAQAGQINYFSGSFVSTGSFTVSGSTGTDNISLTTPNKLYINTSNVLMDDSIPLYIFGPIATDLPGATGVVSSRVAVVGNYTNANVLDLLVNNSAGADTYVKTRQTGNKVGTSSSLVLGTDNRERFRITSDGRFIFSAYQGSGTIFTNNDMYVTGNLNVTSTTYTNKLWISSGSTSAGQIAMNDGTSNVVWTNNLPGLTITSGTLINNTDGTIENLRLTTLASGNPASSSIYCSAVNVNANTTGALLTIPTANNMSYGIKVQFTFRETDAQNTASFCELYGVGTNYSGVVTVLGKQTNTVSLPASQNWSPSASINVSGTNIVINAWSSKAIRATSYTVVTTAS